MYQQLNTNELLPPKAPGYIPILGHILQLIKPIPIHILFSNWSHEVGPIYTCYFGAQRWIVLNSSDLIKDLIVGRGTIYSSRKMPTALTEDLFQGEKGGAFAFMPYGSKWRSFRRIAHLGLIKPKITLYQTIIDERRTSFISHLYHISTENENMHGEGISLSYFIEHYTLTSILAIVFGDMCFFEPSDPLLHRIFSLTERAAKALSPSDQIKEFFPILKKILPKTKTRYIEISNDVQSFYNALLQQFKTQENRQKCFVKDIIDQGELTDLQIIHFIALFVGAGSETTGSTIEWAVAYLANHPEIQEMAYEEIKSQIGLYRLPGADDEPLLPFVQCIILETLRMRPPAPVAIPHATSTDDTYKSWHIPKGTIIVMNLFAIHHDPIRYPDPYQFKPERHIQFVKDTLDDRKLSQSVEDRPHLSFSTGRRVCVGIHLAERSLFMALSALLACFKIERVSEQLIDVDVVRDVRGATLAIPHYKIRLIPRHDKVSLFTK
ncbi:cytochrome P450 [Rhizopus microsporus ATCC 52813]|uniref:Cytochrome P450 n=2 Tax=Rhizopus microsporus TaxID=58291 RepID=A0A2G4SSA6_RHIZD|nr:cytochrome P450 [Rhizopus microsporus ATCC 52813]PHZ11667.1 cytochrome P450 [Rhizopus microsporus ATCC 52813]